MLRFPLMRRLCSFEVVGSPSKKFYELGYYVDAGFGKWYNKNGTQVTDSVTDMANLIKYYERCYINNSRFA